MKKKLQNIVFQKYYFCSRTIFIDISTYGNLLFATVFIIYRINKILFQLDIVPRAITLMKNLV